MLGIDYEKADLDTRALFAFQGDAAKEAMLYLKETYHLCGVIILSTCNRTEIYVSTKDKSLDIIQMICNVKKVSRIEYETYMVCREEQEAIHHLFQLGCGMKSKVFGEDQIITQIKNALSVAREIGTTDSNLEKVFQSAITAAKRVKAEVHLTAVKTSVIEEMKKALYTQKDSLEGLKCLVIGNGEIGRMAATCMVEEKAEVTVTVRSYKTRQVEIPMGCKVIDYQDRFLHLSDCDIIISATASPHHTVKYEDTIELFQDGKHRILIDLAVPRDISSKFAEEDCVTLYDIDSLGGASITEQDNKAMAMALQIIKDYEEKLHEEKERKHHLSTIQSIGELGGAVCYKRIRKQLNQKVDEESQDVVEELIRDGTKRTISAMLFDMKKELPRETWETCLQAMKQALESKEY